MPNDVFDDIPIPEMHDANRAAEQFRRAAEEVRRRNLDVVRHLANGAGGAGAAIDFGAAPGQVFWAQDLGGIRGNINPVPQAVEPPLDRPAARRGAAIPPPPVPEPEEVIPAEDHLDEPLPPFERNLNHEVDLLERLNLIYNKAQRDGKPLELLLDIIETIRNLREGYDPRLDKQWRDGYEAGLQDGRNE